MKKRLLSIFLALCMALSLFPLQAIATADFPDMPAEGHWSYAALKKAVDKGLLRGDGGLLRPQENLTRAQLAAIVNRAFGAEAAADISGYSDLQSTAWYYADIAKAVRMGTFQGNGSQMRPNDSVTRQEAFAVLARAFKLTDGAQTALSEFSDRGQISSWAVPALAAMANAGYIHGSGGMLRPLSSISRAEFAQVMDNMAAIYLSAAGTYTSAIDGNAVISVPGVTLRGVTVSGDLIIGDGVGNGDVTLDGVTVQGRVVIRGGGENSIHIINSSDVGSIVVGKTGDGGLRIRTEEGCRVQVVYVDDGRDDIILEGVYSAINVNSDTPVTLRDATVTTLTVQVGSAAVTLTGSTAVTLATITGSAVGATVTVENGTKITLVESAASDVVIQGDGTVTEAKISGNNTAVNTQNTDVTVSEGTTGVTENGTSVAPGGSTPSGSTGSGDTDTGRAVVGSEEAFVAAANNSAVESIEINGEFTLDTNVELHKPLTVRAGTQFNIGAATLSMYSTLTNNGTIVTVNVPEHGVQGWLRLCFTNLSSVDAGRLVNNGTFINAGHLELNAFASVAGNGIENEGTVHYADLLGLDEHEPDRAAAYEAVRLSDITGDTENIAAAFGISALQSALLKNLPLGDLPFYTGIYLIGEDVTLTATEDLTVRGGQTVSLNEGITLVVPEDKTFHIAAGSELQITGTLRIPGGATNQGLCIKEATGTIEGMLTDLDSGRHYNGYFVSDNASWATAYDDTHCFYADITAGDITLSGDSVVNFCVFVEEGASLTVASGARLELTTEGGAEITSEPYIGIYGTLTNQGVIALGLHTGIRPSGQGILINEPGAVIDVKGWMDIPGDSLGGTVNYYANLTDYARALWSRLGGILPQTVAEADYVTYADALTRLGEEDAEGRYAIVWLLKNEVLKTSDLEDSGIFSDPYAFVSSDAASGLLEDFAAKISKPYIIGIPAGGVLTSNGGEGQGSSFDNLMDQFAASLNVSSVNVSSENELRELQERNYVSEIHITANITLSDNFTICKHVVVDSSAALTLAANKNLTIDWQKEPEAQEGTNGVLIINGSLVIPAGSELINRCEVDLSGEIENGGTFSNLKDEDFCGSLFSVGGTLHNSGIFANEGDMHLSDTALINSGTRFTNNGNLEITGGSVESTAEFHNAGYMKIIDEYGKEGGAVTVLSFGSTLTNNSNWIEYTAAVYTSAGFVAAQAAQNAKVEALGSTPATTGLEIYNRMDIMGDVELTDGSSITISGWDIWVETETHWDGEAESLVRHSLTINSGASLTMDNCTLHINGDVTNSGTLSGNIQVWPSGVLENNGTAQDACVNRMDEFAANGAAEVISSGKVTGSGSIGKHLDIAIVHDWPAFKYAAEYEVSGILVYERIDVQGDHCDVTLQGDLTVSANIYVEWDDSITVPDGFTLTLAGEHWLNNSGDIFVNGMLLVGAEITFNNDEHILIYGTVKNDGLLCNRGTIDLMGGGTIDGSGAVISLRADGFGSSAGIITCSNYQLAETLDALQNALSEGRPALIAGDFTLNDNLSLGADVRIGYSGHWGGTLHTGGHTLTVPAGVTLDICDGELDIDGNGSAINNGTLTIREHGGLRIEENGTFLTDNPVDVFGWIKLYDWDLQHTYITGDVRIYANECDLVQNLYRCLYTVDETTGAPTGLRTDNGITAGMIVPYENFNEESKLDAIGENTPGWDQLAEDPFNRYAYAALLANGIMTNEIDPYSKLSSAQAKKWMGAVANKLGKNLEVFLNSVPDSDLIRSNDFTADQQSTFDTLCSGFKDALVTALIPQP